MKMMEDQIHALESGKGIEYCPEGRVWFSREALQITVGARCRRSVFRHIQPACHIRVGIRRKQKGDPGKGTSKHIEAKRPNQAGTKVYGPVPAGILALYRPVDQHMERDLLFVKIIAQSKDALAPEQ